MRNLTLLLVGTLSGVVGCLPAAPSEVPPSGTGVKTDSPTTPTTPTAPQPQTCGSDQFALDVLQVPPNVYLVVDRSGSMSDLFDNNKPGTKWDAAQAALAGLLTNNVGKAQWGLSLFPPNPSQNTCGKANIDVPLLLGSEAAILTKINSLTNEILASPRGSTPTADALKTVRDGASLTATDRGNFVVLVTDGLPQCNSASDVTATIDELYARSPSVRTFVVGVGSETASNPTLLNDWAAHGHTDRTDPNQKYYQANDATQLASAFSTIFNQTASCQFAVTPPNNVDATLVVGQIDGASLPNDPINGFTYDAATKSGTFHGTACDKITQHTAMKVGVVYGCPAPTIL